MSWKKSATETKINNTNKLHMLTNKKNSIFAETTDFISCSHSRSIELFTESILSDCQFQAYPCDSFNDFTRAKCLSCDGQPCPIMGINADKYEYSTVKPRGKFYLTTGKESPFCGM